MNENRFKETNQFDGKANRGITLFDFSAEWCAPCKAQAQIIKNLISLYEDRVSIIGINVDEHRELAQEHMVQSIPTLIIFKDSKEIKRFVGLQTESTIAKSLDQVI
jgi:thioredoxin 1